MEFGILGPLRVCTDGREVPIQGRKQRTLLAALLLAREGVLSDERLIALLWGQRPPATVNAQLYTYVSRLRMRLGAAVDLVRVPAGYRLGIGSAQFDAAEFHRLSRSGHEALREGRPDRAARLLRTALDLWRGPSLGGVTDQLREAETPQLDEARMAALESRLEAELALGEHRQMVAELTGLVARFPLRERLRAQWMTALYRCERQAEALAVYNEGRRLLSEELGVDPGPALTATHRAVLNGGLAWEEPRHRAAVLPGAAGAP
ncbi:BTAD domain-containing putative transcriptional regulator [Streptomyces sp. NPDC059874]|uniref:AfsR/SARP family transcriptional regulator n=1 Tax=Streptomyces sp. NPDC059874 TaxID=3346983 RepID=UPI00364E57BE